MKFNVPDMSCGHCTSAIDKAIKSSDKGAAITCDLSDRTVSVESTLSAAELTSTLKDAGYESSIQ
ncbi:MAG: heavy-metal-associated domain-containing protein [Paracoccaceae bacterium]|nr:heavy-metal-associated domain-containing protein [Paracoccaceae bacterium]